jgi:hypothetical protein
LQTSEALPGPHLSWGGYTLTGVIGFKQLEDGSTAQRT